MVMGHERMELPRFKQPSNMLDDRAGWPSGALRARVFVGRPMLLKNCETESVYLALKDGLETGSVKTEVQPPDTCEK